MKTYIRTTDDKSDEKVTIDCCEVTQEILNLRDYAESVGANICGTSDGKPIVLPLSEILYLEAVDENVFAYTEKSVADVRGRLYEYEDRLSDKGFVRISKSILVNLSKVRSLSPSPGRKFEALLSNGERVIISRQYAVTIKNILLGGKVNEF